MIKTKSIPNGKQISINNVELFNIYSGNILQVLFYHKFLFIPSGRIFFTLRPALLMYIILSGLLL